MPEPYLYEVKHLEPESSDLAKVVVKADTNVSNIQIIIYDPTGAIHSTHGIETYQSKITDREVYTLNNVRIQQNGAVALSNGVSIVDFVSFGFKDTVPKRSASTIESTQIEPLEKHSNPFVNLTEDSEQNNGCRNRETVPCFLFGTKITTKRGEIPIEDLQLGDMVVVRDGGFVPIRWIGSHRVDARGSGFEKLAPIRIPKGAIARGVPARDLYVSPNHKVWMHDASFEMLFEEREVLISARQLVGWKGIEQVSYIPEPEYFCIMLDAHQIIISDGMQTESLNPGGLEMKQIKCATHIELLQVPSSLIEVFARGETARRCLQSHEARLALQTKWAA